MQDFNNNFTENATGNELIHIAAAVANKGNERTQAIIAPRDRDKIESKILRMCEIKEWADNAFYSLSFMKDANNRPVTGFSAEAANDLACVWGNILSETAFVSVEGVSPEYPCGTRSIYTVSCTDLETNYTTKKTIAIDHMRKRKDNAIVPITDPKDIRYHCEAFVSRALRERILACIPLEIKHKAKELIIKTRESSANPQEDLARILAAFKKYNITRAQALAAIGLDEFTVHKLNGGHISDLKSIGVSIKEGNTTINEWIQKDTKIFSNDLPELPE